MIAVVVVSYNSAEHLRACVEPLLGLDEIQVVVVDNASTDGSGDRVRDLPLTLIELPENRGFAAGCNVGWCASEARTVLFLNPDATIDHASVSRLAQAVEEPGVGAAAPKILEADGSVAPSLRRFPRPYSMFAQAAFLHRLLPDAAWATELEHREDAYAHPHAAEWVSGACVMVRRDTLERLDGLDEGFFMYCEDKDLCRRIWDLGHSVRYEPDAVAVHHGGASAPRTALLPVLATSRVRYASKHGGPAMALLERLGVALWACTHVIAARGGRAARAGFARALLVAGAPLRADGGKRFVAQAALGGRSR